MWKLSFFHFAMFTLFILLCLAKEHDFVKLKIFFFLDYFFSLLICCSFFGNKSGMMDFQCLQVHYNDSHNQRIKYNRCIKVFLIFFPMKKWRWESWSQKIVIQIGLVIVWHGMENCFLYTFDILKVIQFCYIVQGKFWAHLGLFFLVDIFDTKIECVSSKLPFSIFLHFLSQYLAKLIREWWCLCCCCTFEQ